MKPTIHIYYTRLSIKREMASTRKSRKLYIDEIPSRTIQEENQWILMNQMPNKGDFVEENDVLGGSSTSTRRRSPTPSPESTTNHKFNEIIFSIPSMMGSITTM